MGRGGGEGGGVENKFGVQRTKMDYSISIKSVFETFEKNMRSLWVVLRIRIRFHTDPDPAVNLNIRIQIWIQLFSLPRLKWKMIFLLQLLTGHKHGGLKEHFLSGMPKRSQLKSFNRHVLSKFLKMLNVY